MPAFDIVKKSPIIKSYRVARVSADYDYTQPESVEHFTGEVEMPDKWNIGLIVGSSGTGKTTIARQLFGDNIVDGYEWSAPSVIDDMPSESSVDDITRCFYQVGFGSVPSWLKPYSVLSNGEKMRCNLARALLENDFVVFDEFTSVVDRNVAKTISQAISKGIKERDVKFVAVSCHRDIIEWLQPDWVFDTDVMRPFVRFRQDQSESSQSEIAHQKHGNAIGVITI